MGDRIPVVYKRPFERNYEGDARHVTSDEYERIKPYVKRTDTPQGVDAAPTAPPADKAAQVAPKDEQREQLAKVASQPAPDTDTDEGGDPDLLAALDEVDVDDWSALKAFAREHEVDDAVSLKFRGEKLRDSIAKALADK